MIIPRVLSDRYVELKTHSIIDMSLNFIQGITECYSLGYNHSVSSEETALKREKSIYL